jgi:hypothetical protein
VLLINEGDSALLETDNIYFHKMVSTKIKIATKLLEAGITVLLFDIDSVWVQNPFPYLTKPVSIIGNVT